MNDKFNYPRNVITGMVRDLARRPHGNYIEVPSTFADGHAKISAVEHRGVIVATVEDAPIISVREFQEFIDETFGRLVGYRVALRFVGGIGLKNFVSQHSNVLNQKWQSSFRSMDNDRYSLEFLRVYRNFRPAK